MQHSLSTVGMARIGTPSPPALVIKWEYSTGLGVWKEVPGLSADLTAQPNIAFQRPPKATVDFRPILVKRLWHTGSGLRPRPVADKVKIARAVEENVWPLIAAGRVKPVIFKTFPLREAAAAHALMETSQHIGKIVLTV